MKTGNINKILSSNAPAAMNRSSSSSSSSSSDSISEESASEKSSSLQSQQPSKRPTAANKAQRQRNSYASATASSKARGGPTSTAPAAKSAAAMKAAVRPLPKFNLNNDDEENNVNQSTTATTALGSQIMSPTPYYKVLEERGGKTSPRLTRSAAKRAQTKLALDSLAQLDSSTPNRDGTTPLPHGATHNANNSRTNNNNNNSRTNNTNNGSRTNSELDSTRITLNFQPPDRPEWNVPRNKSKVRKSVGVSSSRNVRRKFNNNNSNNSGGNSSGGGNNNGGGENEMNMDQMRQIVTETLQSSNQDKLLQLSANVAVAQKEVESLKSQLSEVQLENGGLEECLRIKEGEECAMKKELEDCQGEVERLKSELNVCHDENGGLKEQLKRDGHGWNEERERMIKEYDGRVNESQLELRVVQKEHEALKRDHNGVMGELEVVKAKLVEVTRQNEQLEVMSESANGNNCELVQRIAVLEREKAQLVDENAAHVEQVQTLKSDLDQKESEVNQMMQVQTQHEAVITEHENTIEQLRTDLEDADHRLDDANRTMEVMQSPKSKEAMEYGYTQEMQALRNEIYDMKKLLKEANETREDLKLELDQSKSENGVLLMQLKDLNVKMEDAKVPAAQLESENAAIVQQLGETKMELKESQHQLEELAVENEQALAKLDEKENDLLQAVEEMEMQSKQLVDVQSQLKSIVSEKKELLSENETLATELNQLQDEVSQLQSQVGSLEANLTDSRHQAESLSHQKQESDQKLHELSNQLQTLTTHLETAQGTISSLEDKLRAKAEYCEQFETIERKLVQEKNVLNEIRRTLHNKVIQLTGNIRVYVRVRPLIPSEQQLTLSSSSSRPSSAASRRPSSRGSIASAFSSSQQQQEECFHFPGLADRKLSGNTSKSSNYTSTSDLSKQTIELTEPHRERGGLNPRRKKWRYGFDKVFNPVNDQEDVWEGAEPLVQSAIDGHNVCMFAFGQTSSGKTHTMIGDSVNRGLIPRAVEKLFAAKKEIEQSFQGNVTVSVKVELLEIYNEEVFDLLNDEAGPKGQKIKIRLNSNEAVNNVVVEASNQGEVQGVLHLAQQRRCVKATKSNAESSRSHLLFTIRFELSSLTNDEMNRQGVLHIVDLAGSERLDKSGSQGALLTEAKHINTSLSALSHVIQKLQDKSEHIPYRDSKLTYLLRDSLGGDSKTLCIVCCSPHQAHFNESLNSIRFAANASKVELKQGNKVDV